MDPNRGIFLEKNGGFSNESSSFASQAYGYVDPFHSVLLGIFFFSQPRFPKLNLQALIPLLWWYKSACFPIWWLSSDQVYFTVKHCMAAGIPVLINPHFFLHNIFPNGYFYAKSKTQKNASLISVTNFIVRLS